MEIKIKTGSLQEGAELSFKISEFDQPYYIEESRI
jgi:hypothetical protein